MALFCLLFQQQVMASYVCQAVAGSTGGAMMTGNCAGMATPHAGKAMHQDGDPRCAEHCANHTPQQADARLPAVPALMLPAAPPLVSGSVIDTAASPVEPEHRLRRSEPPPSLRFCTLLI